MENTSNSIAWWSKSSTLQKVLIFAFISLLVFSVFLKGENNARKKLKDCLAITGYSFTGNCQMGSIIGDATITIDKEGNSASVTYSALGSQATESGKLANLILEEGGPDNTYKIVGDWKVEGNASQGARFYFSVFADKPNTVICQISNSQFAYYDNKELITEDFLKIKELLKSSGSNNESNKTTIDTSKKSDISKKNSSSKAADPAGISNPIEDDILLEDLYWIKDEKVIIAKYKGYEEGDLFHLIFQTINGDEYDFSEFPTACPYIDENNQIKSEYIDQLFKINWQSLEPKRNGEFDYPYNRITSIELYSNDHNLKSTTLKTPCYIINVAAVKTEIEAKTVSEKLRLQGKKSNYLWIPDYPSLSGVNYFSVFIGPYNSQYECEVATEEYKVLNPNAYGLLVSHERKRVRINGIGKVITTNN